MRVVESEVTGRDSSVKQLLLWRWLCFIEKYVGAKTYRNLLWQTVMGMLYLFERMQHPASSPKVIEEAPLRFKSSAKNGRSAWCQI
jgi:hypothetical protein